MNLRDQATAKRVAINTYATARTAAAQAITDHGISSDQALGALQIATDAAEDARRTGATDDELRTV